MKTILLHVQDDDSIELRLQTALTLARAFGGHLSCLHVTPVDAYVAFNAFGGVFVMADVLKALDEHETELQERIENQLRKEDVSWDYQQLTGTVDNMIVAHGALADVIVTGRAVHRATSAVQPVSLMGNLLHNSRTPLLIPAANGKDLDPAGTAIIAWNGSFEAANAVRASLGALRLASSIEVVRVDTETEGLFPATRLLEYLSRHDIHAELRLDQSRDGNVAEALIGRALQIGASLIVMGGYSRNRLSEYIFGGVTRDLLRASPVSLLVAH